MDLTEEVLIDLIARIAQHACRQGERKGREWPPLATLPSLESWRCVGETYAADVLRSVRAADVLAPIIRPPQAKEKDDGA